MLYNPSETSKNLLYLDNISKPISSYSSFCKTDWCRSKKCAQLTILTWWYWAQISQLIHPNPSLSSEHQSSSPLSLWNQCKGLKRYSSTEDHWNKINQSTNSSVCEPFRQIWRRTDFFSFPMNYSFHSLIQRSIKPCCCFKIQYKHYKHVFLHFSDARTSVNSNVHYYWFCVETQLHANIAGRLFRAEQGNLQIRGQSSG